MQVLVKNVISRVDSPPRKDRLWFVIRRDTSRIMASLVASANKNPEQIARDKIDARLATSGWAVQDKSGIDPAAAPGIAVREYTTSVGPADYVLFSNKKPLGVVEAKPELVGREDHHRRGSVLRLCVCRTQVGKEQGAAKFHLRGDWRPHPLHRRARSEAALARSLQLPSTGNAARMGGAAEIVPRPPAGLARPRHDRVARLPDHGNQQSRSVTQGGQTARSHPDGDGLGQDLHRDQRGVPAPEIRGHEARPVPSRYAQPRRAGGTGVHGLRAERRQPQVHRALHCPAPQLVVHLERRAGLHLDHPAPLFDPEGRGDARGRRRGEVRRSGARSARSRCPSSTTRSCRPNSSTSSSSTSAIAQFTICGDKWSNISTPSSSASPPRPTIAPTASSRRTSSASTPTKWRSPTGSMSGTKFTSSTRR